MSETVEINRSSIIRAMGLHVTAAQVKDVVVPSDALAQAEEKMDSYHKAMKRRHASLKNKLKNIFMKENTDADELDRRSKLKEAMEQTKGWLDGATRYFKGCKKVDILLKYQKEVKSDYATLKSKKYIPDDLKCKEFDINYYNLSSSGCPGRYLENCRKAYQSIYANMLQLLMVNDAGSDSLDAKYRAERNKTREKIKGDVKELRQLHRKFRYQLISFYDEAKKKFNKVMSTVKNPDTEMQAEINKVKRKMVQFEEFLKTIEAEEATLKFDIYFNSKGKDANLRFKSTCSGTIIELNDLYDMMVGGYVYDEIQSNFSKQIKKRVKELNEDVKQGGEMSKETAKFFEEESKIKDAQKEADKNAEKLEKLIQKSRNKLNQLKTRLLEFLSEAEKIEDAYKAWERDKSSRKLKMAFFITFAVLGVALPLFNQFLPIVDAKLNPELSPIKPCPQ